MSETVRIPPLFRPTSHPKDIGRWRELMAELCKCKDALSDYEKDTGTKFIPAEDDIARIETVRADEPFGQFIKWASDLYWIEV